MITFFSLISGLFMSIIYCLLHMGVRLGQRSILNRRAGRRRPRILEFGVQKKKFSHRAFSQLSPLLVWLIMGRRGGISERRRSSFQLETNKRHA